MKIELLLNRMSYDQVTKSSDRAFNGWLHGPGSGDPDIKDRQPLPKFGLRKESWGGVFVYGPTGQVYAVDDVAYGVLERIAAGESLDKIASEGRSAEVGSFRQKLSDFGIQIPT